MNDRQFEARRKPVYAPPNRWIAGGLFCLALVGVVVLIVAVVKTDNRFPPAPTPAPTPPANLDVVCGAFLDFPASEQPQITSCGLMGQTRVLDGVCLGVGICRSTQESDVIGAYSIFTKRNPLLTIFNEDCTAAGDACVARVPFCTRQINAFDTPFLFQCDRADVSRGRLCPFPDLPSGGPQFFEESPTPVRCSPTVIGFCDAQLSCVRRVFNGQIDEILCEETSAQCTSEGIFCFCDNVPATPGNCIREIFVDDQVAVLNVPCTDAAFLISEDIPGSNSTSPNLNELFCQAFLDVPNEQQRQVSDCGATIETVSGTCSGVGVECEFENSNIVGENAIFLDLGSSSRLLPCADEFACGIGGAGTPCQCQIPVCEREFDGESVSFQCTTRPTNPMFCPINFTPGLQVKLPCSNQVTVGSCNSQNQCTTLFTACSAFVGCDQDSPDSCLCSYGPLADFTCFLEDDSFVSCEDSVFVQ